jgi:hypothetical protein
VTLLCSGEKKVSEELDRLHAEIKRLNDAAQSHQQQQQQLQQQKEQLETSLANKEKVLFCVLLMYRLLTASVGIDFSSR